MVRPAIVQSIAAHGSPWMFCLVSIPPSPPIFSASLGICGPAAVILRLSSCLRRINWMLPLPTSPRTLPLSLLLLVTLLPLVDRSKFPLVSRLLDCHWWSSASSGSPRPIAGYGNSIETVQGPAARVQAPGDLNVHIFPCCHFIPSHCPHIAQMCFGNGLDNDRIGLEERFREASRCLPALLPGARTALRMYIKASISRRHDA